MLKFGHTDVLTLGRMMEIANRYANGEEDERSRSDKGRAGDANQSGHNHSKQKRKAEAVDSAELAALSGQVKEKGL